MANAGGSSGKGGAIKAGKAYVELSTDDSLLKSGLAKARSMVMKSGAAIAGVGAGLIGLGGVAVAPILGLFKEAARQ